MSNEKCNINISTNLQPHVDNSMVVRRFDCRLKAFPLPNITWTKNELVKVKNGFIKVDIDNYGRREIFSLKIEDAQISDSGMYICTARNQYGTASTQIEDTRVGGRAVENLCGNYSKNAFNIECTTNQIATHEKSGETPVPPHFIKFLPRYIEVPIGTTVWLDCVVTT